ncbi:UCR-hinge domain-containing protein [Mycena indigotica]|uniref:UCR-hinge domain-containing protein n=1 Tax=Mycena indigotica TaxID=2126181 RepID=A0A8H6VRE1_9AGAR|nr:UCR-hinge domain-containing protein [Mycena indigotica]KAF7289201.1 UCR-hinge domain-containing protein [Mycena indigotica]
MSIGDFISSFFPTVHSEAEEKPAEDAPTDEAAAEEPEPEEPEDAHPAIREECMNSASCAPMKHHFEKCQEKVMEGKGHKGEDCVEEMCMSRNSVSSMPC